MRRTTMNVGAATHTLAQGQDADTIGAAVLEAARKGGAIVKVTLYGDRELAVVVTPGVPITFESEDVSDELRDDGNLDSPFEWPSFDFGYGD